MSWTYTFDVTDCADNKKIQYPVYTDGNTPMQGTAEGVITVQYDDSIAEASGVISAANYGPLSVSFTQDDGGNTRSVCLVSLDGPVGEYPGTGSGW
jgi:hypothetical protein